MKKNNKTFDNLDSQVKVDLKIIEKSYPILFENAESVVSGSNGLSFDNIMKAFESNSDPDKLIVKYEGQVEEYLQSVKNLRNDYQSEHGKIEKIKTTDQKSIKVLRERDKSLNTIKDLHTFFLQDDKKQLLFLTKTLKGPTSELEFRNANAKYAELLLRLETTLDPNRYIVLPSTENDLLLLSKLNVDRTTDQKTKLMINGFFTTTGVITVALVGLLIWAALV